MPLGSTELKSLRIFTIVRMTLSLIAALLLVGGGATIAIACGGGSTGYGNAGHDQYNEKPGCGPWKTDGNAGGSGYHDGQPPKDDDRGDCPKPPDECDNHDYFAGYSGGGGKGDDCDCQSGKKGKFSTYGTSGSKKGKGDDDCGRSSDELRFVPLSRA